MSDLQQAMALLIGVFHKYAGSDQLLNKAEMKILLKREFGDTLGNVKDPKVVNEIFQGLDQDGSGTLDFEEFVTMVALLTAITNDVLCRMK
ncbi:ictacalcin-like [Engraulis encrasicolus]|uniref:ictacalcin-like n=1 Tax=Engraulis encrasicolus TaxID=184585 RepID=UPI002FD396BE